MFNVNVAVFISLLIVNLHPYFPTDLLLPTSTAAQPTEENCRPAQDTIRSVWPVRITSLGLDVAKTIANITH